MRWANAHAEPSQHFWHPVPPKAAWVHTHVFSYSDLYLALNAFNLTVGARVAR